MLSPLRPSADLSDRVEPRLDFCPCLAFDLRSDFVVAAFETSRWADAEDSRSGDVRDAALRRGIRDLCCSGENVNNMGSSSSDPCGRRLGGVGGKGLVRAGGRGLRGECEGIGDVGGRFANKSAAFWMDACGDLGGGGGIIEYRTGMSAVVSGCLMDADVSSPSISTSIMSVCFSYA